MSVIATALKHLIAAGVTGDALVTAIAEIEASLSEAVAAEISQKSSSAGAERTRRWRAKKASQSVTCDVTSVTVTSQASQSVTEAPSRAEYNTTRAHAVIPVGITSVIPPIIPPFGTPHEKKSTAKRKTTIPETAQPTDRDRDAADRAGLAPEEYRDEWRAFRDHHLARGSTMLDWPAAWRTWLRNRKRFSGARAGPPKKISAITEAILSLEAQIERENENSAFDCGAFQQIPGIVLDGP